MKRNHLQESLERMRKEERRSSPIPGQQSERKQSSIKENLDRLYSRKQTIKQFPDDSMTRQFRGMHEFVEGEYVSTHFGDIFVGKVRYHKEDKHGKIPLLSIRDVSDDWMSRWGKFSRPKKFNYRKTIFVDTETSGLAGAGGTIAFLIGIGYFYRNEFRVEQFFADSHSREEGMLDLVADFVEPFDTLVTFNGKTFDIPLLETRYLLKRKQSTFITMDHLDLLHPSRQLWNLTLEDCKLQTIEKKLLKFQRVDDLPGSEVPEAYFRYIRYHDPDPLFKVFKHNADDIASLVVLTYLLWKQTNGIEETKDPSVAFSRGKIFRRYNQPEKAIGSMETAIQHESSSHRRMLIRSHLSMLYKSKRDWVNAVTVWKEMIDEAVPFYLLPYVELAKYYEHRIKDIPQAKLVAEMALERIPPHHTRGIDELHYRLDRLRRKSEQLDD